MPQVLIPTEHIDYYVSNHNLQQNIILMKHFK